MNKPFYMYMNVQGMGRNVFTCLITIFLLASCQSYKKVPYLQDVEVVEQTAQQENLYDAKIMTKKEAEQLIIEKLKPYIKETPIVTVRMVNYKISVLGEVARPGTFTINNEKVNLLEALAMAGDMTVWGLRDNVKLIREGADGKQQIITLDLNSAETILSPYYWLQQNDIVYVTPNKAKARNSDIGNSTSLWFSATSILVSLASLLVTIFR